MLLNGSSSSPIGADKVTCELDSVERHQMRTMLKEWVHTTRGFFSRGKRLLGLVPRWLATDVDLFIGGGQAILSEIEKQDFDVWTKRPTVSKWTKIRLLGSALLNRQASGEPIRDASHQRATS